MKIFNMRPYLLICFLLGSFLYAVGQARTSGLRVIVDLESDTDPMAWALRQDLARVEHKRSLSTRLNIHLFECFSDKKPETIIGEISQAAAVESAEADSKLEFRTNPNDPRFVDQWTMERIGMPDAWDVTTGGITARGDTIVVAILDSGFDLDHEDIRDNVWYNHHEIPNDGIDNDGNGFVDDIHGWDFSSDGPNFPFDDHGLSVSGLVGARGNNGIGVTGVNWEVKIMFLSVQFASDIVASYEYVVQMRKKYNDTRGMEGAFVVATNASFGLTRVFCEDQPAWGAMYEELGKVGVLTGASTSNAPVNVEIEGDMPTSCPSPYLVTVLNSDFSDNKFSTSAFGRVSIDMGSPGEGSVTVTPDDGYGTFGGTSAAAPHLSGAIALLYSIPCDQLANDALDFPAETALEIREALLNGVDAIEGLKNYTATGGRLNVANSMSILQDSCGTRTGNLDITRIYPNPYAPSSFGDALQVEYRIKAFEPHQLQVYNMLGQLVYTRELNPRPGELTNTHLNVGDLQQGMYVLQLRWRNERTTAKFVVLKY